MFMSHDGMPGIDWDVVSRRIVMSQYCPDVGEDPEYDHKGWKIIVIHLKFQRQ